jgi:hypothetical protein
MDLILWGSSHMIDKSTDKSGLPEQVKKGLNFEKVWDFSKGGKALDTRDTQQILDWIGANGSTRQIFLFLIGGNNIRNAFRHKTDRYKEITAVVRRYKDILESIQGVGARVILCGTVPDPSRQEVDEVLKDLDLALGSLDLGPLGTFVELRTCLTGPNGQIRKDAYRRKDIHLSSVGNAMVGRRIRSLLEVIGKAPSGPSMTQTKLPTAPALVRTPGPASKQTGVRARVVPPPASSTPPTTNSSEKEARLAELWAEVRGSQLPPPNSTSTTTLALLTPPVQNLAQVSEMANLIDWTNDPELKLDAVDRMNGWTIELTKLQIQFNPAPIQIARPTSTQIYRPKPKRFTVAGMRVVKHVIDPIRPQLAITHVPTITNVARVTPMTIAPVAVPPVRIAPVAGPDAFDLELAGIQRSGNIARNRAQAMAALGIDDSMEFEPFDSSSPRHLNMSGASELLRSYDDDAMVDADVLDQFAAVTVTEPVTGPEPESDPEDEDL